MRNFKQLEVWQKSIDLTIMVYGLTRQLPDSERFGLITQMNRSAVSVPSNIAEGSSRSSEKDYRRFLEIALGSIFELETQLIITQKLNLLPTNAFEECNELIQKIQMMLYGLMRKLNS
jgi:four helix bundle protein